MSDVTITQHPSGTYIVHLADGTKGYLSDGAEPTDENVAAVVAAMRGEVKAPKVKRGKTKESTE